MLLTAVGLAGGIAIGTVVDALVAPFRADEVGECLRVFGDVGYLAIAADARVLEGIGITVVGDGFGALGWRL